jgi:hypothetical protein
MHAYKDLMWRKSWKIWQIFLTKQGLNKVLLWLFPGVRWFFNSITDTVRYTHSAHHSCRVLALARHHGGTREHSIWPLKPRSSPLTPWRLSAGRRLLVLLPSQVATATGRRGTVRERASLLLCLRGPGRLVPVQCGDGDGDGDAPAGQPPCPKHEVCMHPHTTVRRPRLYSPLDCVALHLPRSCSAVPGRISARPLLSAPKALEGPFRSSITHSLTHSCWCVWAVQCAPRDLADSLT